ncbi:hypothetical protein FTX61_08450 [Nitriliruptoraceae bacterium ZYF776]|nr:hypothetical protein [Profundirhabdus halotolerans]
MTASSRSSCTATPVRRDPRRRVVHAGSLVVGRSHAELDAGAGARAAGERSPAHVPRDRPSPPRGVVVLAGAVAGRHQGDRGRDHGRGWRPAMSEPQVTAPRLTTVLSVSRAVLATVGPKVATPALIDEFGWDVTFQAIALLRGDDAREAFGAVWEQLLTAELEAAYASDEVSEAAAPTEDLDGQAPAEGDRVQR